MLYCDPAKLTKRNIHEHSFRRARARPFLCMYCPQVSLSKIFLCQIRQIIQIATSGISNPNENLYSQRGKLGSLIIWTWNEFHRLKLSKLANQGLSQKRVVQDKFPQPPDNTRVVPFSLYRRGTKSRFFWFDGLKQPLIFFCVVKCETRQKSADKCHDISHLAVSLSYRDRSETLRDTWRKKGRQIGGRVDLLDLRAIAG